MERRQPTRYIVIHCSATRPDQDIGVAELDAMHRGFGWSGVGYHGVIRRDGSFEPGRAWDAVGAHVRGHNSESVGVCLIGGLGPDGEPEAAYEPRQLDTLDLIVAGLRRRYPRARVVGHRDLSPDADGSGEVEPDEWLKLCPSFDVSRWLETGEAA